MPSGIVLLLLKVSALVSVVGLDSLGDALLRETAAAGVDVSGVLRVPGAATGSYTAVLGAGGELLLAVAAMDVGPALLIEYTAPAAIVVCGCLAGGLLLRAGAPAGDLTAGHVAACDRLVNDWHGQGPLHLPGDLRVRRDRDRVHIARAPGGQ